MRVLNILPGVSIAQTQQVYAMAVAKRETPTAACIPVAICSATGGNASNILDTTQGTGSRRSMARHMAPETLAGSTSHRRMGGQVRSKPFWQAASQCDISQIGDPVGQTGKQDTLQEAWNTRFGWYRKGGGYSPLEAPPDKTGFAYSNLTEAGAPNGGKLAERSNAYSGTSSVPNQPNFSQARGVNKPYQETIPVGIKINQYNQPLQAAQLVDLGRVDRRVVAAPVVNCSIWNTPPGSQMPPILGWACVLMLNPMENGSVASDIAKLEFLGLASDADSPCAGGSEFSIAPVLTQ